MCLLLILLKRLNFQVPPGLLEIELFWAVQINYAGQNTRYLLIYIVNISLLIAVTSYTNI